METLSTGSTLIPIGRHQADALILSLRGELDLHNSPDLRYHLFDLMGKAKPARLILDMDQVPYMDSSALAVLVEALKRLMKTNGRVFLINLQPRVKGLLEIARLSIIFNICKDEKEALEKN